MLKKQGIRLACTAAYSVTVACAQGAVDMGDVTVTATQDATLKVYEAPSSVDVVTAEDMEQQGITRMDELFKSISGVDAKTAGGSVMPVIRGLSDEQVLILVDGVRLSDERPGGNHILSIDPAQIARIEVVKGAGSVLYGAGAIGGVVNIITKKAPQSGEDRFKVSGDIAVGYESNNKARKLQSQLNVSKENLTVYLGGIRRKTDNRRSPTETIRFSFYDGYTLWGGGEYRYDKWTTSVNVWQNKADIGITAPRTFQADFFKGETHTKVDLKTVYADQNGTLRRFELLFSRQKHLRRRIQQPSDTKLVDIGVDKETTTLRGQWSLQLDAAHRTTVGFDLFDEDLTSSRFMQGFPPVIGAYSGVPVIAPSSRQGVGVFVQDVWRYDQKLTVTTGIRYDKIKTQTSGAPAPFFITRAQSDTDGAFSGEIGVVYRITPQTNLYADIGRAFRAPTLIERYFFGPHDGPAQDRGNPELDPETSLNLNVGIRTYDDAYRLHLSLFYNRVDDLIQKVLTNPDAPVDQRIFQYQNISQAALYGGEFDATYFINEAWSAFASASIIRGEDTRTYTPLTRTPPYKIRYGVAYEKEWGKSYLNLELSALSAASQDRLGVGERRTPGYTRVDAKAYLVYNEYVSFSLTIDNVLDTTYYDHLSYGWQVLDYAAQGRNVSFEMTYRF